VQESRFLLGDIAVYRSIELQVDESQYLPGGMAVFRRIGSNSSDSVNFQYLPDGIGVYWHIGPNSKVSANSQNLRGVTVVPASRCIENFQYLGGETGDGVSRRIELTFWSGFVNSRRLRGDSGLCHIESNQDDSRSLLQRIDILRGHTHNVASCIQLHCCVVSS
jgi:hypothetical protein